MIPGLVNRKPGFCGIEAWSLALIVQRRESPDVAKVGRHQPMFFVRADAQTMPEAVFFKREANLVLQQLSHRDDHQRVFRIQTGGFDASDICPFYLVRIAVRTADEKALWRYAVHCF
ncbi:hypothetical protein FACS189475_03910 [Betaproteobacteria bacterium]|nr:hypothetical protein FACS189475_03910 [Betaproteobacteria bacterium]